MASSWLYISAWAYRSVNSFPVTCKGYFFTRSAYYLVPSRLILCKRFKDISYFSRMRSLVGYAHAPVLHVAFVSALALARGFCPWLLHVLARGFLHVAFARGFCTWFFARGFCTWLLHVLARGFLHVAFARGFCTWFFARGFCTWLFSSSLAFASSYVSLSF